MMVDDFDTPLEISYIKIHQIIINSIYLSIYYNTIIYAIV